MSKVCERCSKSFDDSNPVRYAECYGRNAYYACPHCGKLYRYYLEVRCDPVSVTSGESEDDWGNKIYNDKEYIEKNFNIKLEDGEMYYVSTNAGEFEWIVAYKDDGSELGMASYLNLSLYDEVIEFNNLLCYYTDINSLRKATNDEVDKFMSILNKVYNLKWDKESKELKEL